MKAVNLEKKSIISIKNVFHRPSAKIFIPQTGIVAHAQRWPP